MTIESRVTAACTIRENQVFSGDQLVFESPASTTPQAFLLDAYNWLDTGYAKFYKMSDLCKLAFIAAEVVMRSLAGKQTSGSRTGIVLNNCSSSLSADSQYIRQTFPPTGTYDHNPALFVYTLPNIAIGEIAIRHGITGENVFFVGESHSPELLKTYVDCLFEQNLADSILHGFVEDQKNIFSVSLFFSEKKITFT
jgi:hypothetical protein